MPTHNKLVRDRIPEIIAGTGKKYSTRILDQSEFIKELRKKSFEELEEYMNANNHEEALEELADLLEIIHALAESHSASIGKVEELRKNKAVKRGKFKEKIFLIQVDD
ncbi:phosphoribosyl-ATP pyrophosphohydrolase [Sporosarcina globispora]|uniref:Phosphoribosyl-ATP pyrophosphohydrolase n=1 Tax=Sporosarcina globispora TaxID=1459 RepID=A0A0M0GDQ3_SPOGL|nr:nucleoside triphosphate pyrophosphohydrolase [Sporosarcina globispora]KON87964.1 phosphoribosyl-ATP pyrophosphohydrolase [Sporosarcina globispora]